MNIFAKPGLAITQIPGSTSADSGKVLKVGEDGTPEWGEGGGGSSDVLVINATIDAEHAESEEEFPLILDKTYEEMAAADNMTLVVDLGPAKWRLPLASKATVGEDGIYLGFALNVGDGLYRADIIASSESITATLYVAELGHLPSVTDADNGKILKVDDGAWAAVTDILILHGTLTSTTGGTITETPQDLMDAITENKRIIFAVTMPSVNGTADYNVECTVTKVEDSKPHAYGTCSTEGSALLAVYIGESNDSLVFTAAQYALTPVSP